MFLETLYKNYDSILEQTGSQKPISSYAVTKYHWKVCLFSDNPNRYTFLSLLDDKKNAKEEMLLHSVTRSGSGAKAFYLSDKAEFVFKVCEGEISKNILENHEDFKNKLLSIYEATQNTYVKVIYDFLQSFNSTELPANLLPSHRIVFDIDGSVDYITDPEIVKYINRNKVDEAGDEICLITGKKCKTLIKSDKLVKNLPGKSNNGGFFLFSNNENDYRSYGLSDLKTSPVSLEGSEKVHDALNALLSSKDHSNTFGNLKFIWFSNNKADLPVFQDPKIIKDFLTSYENGTIFSERTLKKSDKFYLYCLGTNYVRVRIHFPYETSVGHMYQTQFNWLNNTSIKINNEVKHFPMWLLIKNLDNPGYEKDLFKAAFMGTKFSLNLVSYLTSIIKGKQLKSYKHKDKNEFAILGLLAYHCRVEKGINMENIDDNTDIGFILGRLFHEYERLQLEASPNIGSTITSKFLNKAMTNPLIVFANLNAQAQKYIELMKKDDRKAGIAYVISKRINHLLSLIVAQGAVPKKLSVSQQASFVLGQHCQSNLINEIIAQKRLEKVIANEV
jgi:CRISPR-associated protein Csd1